MKCAVVPAGLAAAVLIALGLGISSVTASRVYGIQDMVQRLQTAHSYYLKGWHYYEYEGPDGKMRTEKIPAEMYIGLPCQFYRRGFGNNNGIIGTNYGAEDAERYINVDHLRKKCYTGRNYTFATESVVLERLEQMPRTLIQQKFAAYQKTRSERIGGVDTDVYEASYPADEGRLRDAVWLNPVTGLPVRVANYKQKSGQPERLFLEYDLVEVDAPPPAGLFTFEPPTGYEVIHQDRGPESVAHGSMGTQGDSEQRIRFRYNIGDRAILLCWAWFDTVTKPRFEPDPANPPGQQQRLTLTSSTNGRKYRLVPVRTDPADGFHWRWSLVIPDDGKPIGADMLFLTFKSKHGTGRYTLDAWQKLSRRTLADFVLKAQRITLGPDAPAEAALTLEQIEAKIDELSGRAGG
jgi:hypothetical protein